MLNSLGHKKIVATSFDSQPPTLYLSIDTKSCLLAFSVSWREHALINDVRKKQGNEEV